MGRFCLILSSGMIKRAEMRCQIELKSKDADPRISEAEDARKRLAGLKQ